MTSDPDAKVILPGQTVGIYGGGQLGRMLAMVARRNGYRVHVYTDDPHAPAGHFANQVTIGADADESTFRQFAESIDVLTFEFENVSAQALQWVPPYVPIRPRGNVFWTAQNRQREKQFLQDHNIPLPPFARVDCPEDLPAACQQLGLPAVLKTSAGGYDGKGQFLIRQPDQLAEAWQAVGGCSSTLEKFIDLACEISIIVARDIYGNTAVYGPIENQHANHILDLSFCPASVGAEVALKAGTIARQITAAFDLVGLICVEFFVTTKGEVLVNEIAPRTHNSGHLTIEAFATSQFEQQLRAVCGLPLGSVQQFRPAAMVNLLGDLWCPAEPEWKFVADYPATYLHLYEKPTARVGRKMGHLTVCAESVEQAKQIALKVRSQIAPSANSADTMVSASPTKR